MKFDQRLEELFNEMEVTLPKYKVKEFRKKLFEKIASYVKEEGKLTLPGFGTFKLATRAARKVKVPTTGAVVDVPERKVIKFRMSKKLY